MSNKQSLSTYTLFFTILNIHLFKPSLEYSVLTISILCLIDKSSQFCNTGNKYEVAIICTFGRRLRMSTISAVPTCTANMHVFATLRKYRVLKY